MGPLLFLVAACAVFLVVGPLLPFPTMFLLAAVLTGDLSQLQGAFLLSGISYLFGWPIALGFGIVFAVLLLLVVRCFPGVIAANPGLRVLLGVGLGASLSGVFLIRMLAGASFHGPTFVAFFLVPTLSCGALVTCWLLPKLSVNWSLKSRPPTAAA